MDRKLRRKLLQGLGCIVCVALWWSGPAFELAGTEFSGGYITGPMLAMFDTATLVFLVAAIAAFFLPRMAAAIGLIACLLRFPFYLYFLFPGPFRWVVSHFTHLEWSTPLWAQFSWQTWAVLGIVIHAITASIWQVRSARSNVLDGTPV